MLNTLYNIIIKCYKQVSRIPFEANIPFENNFIVKRDAWNNLNILIWRTSKEAGTVLQIDFVIDWMILCNFEKIITIISSHLTKCIHFRVRNDGTRKQTHNNTTLLAWSRTVRSSLTTNIQNFNCKIVDLIPRKKIPSGLKLKFRTDYYTYIYNNTLHFTL